MLAVVHYTRRCAKNPLLTLPFFGRLLLVSPFPPELQKAQMIFQTRLALQQPLKLLLESLYSSCTTNKERDDIGSSVITVFNVYCQKSHYHKSLFTRHHPWNCSYLHCPTLVYKHPTFQNASSKCRKVKRGNEQGVKKIVKQS